jgi:ketosteroid isomerase-like protein
MSAEGNLQLVREYLGALARMAPASEMAAFFTEDAEQIELPNRLNPNGQASDLHTLLERVDKGRAMLSEQHYEVTNVISSGDSAAVEADWSGKLKNGAELRAHFAMFFEFRDGRIAKQRNYDCFEPF